MKFWKLKMEGEALSVVWISDSHFVLIIHCGSVIEEIPAINSEFTCSSLRTWRIRALFSSKIVMNSLSKPCLFCGINCYYNSGQGIERIRRKVPCKSYLTLKALVSLLLCRNFRTILGHSILLFWFFCFLYRKYILFCSYWIIRPKYIYKCKPMEAAASVFPALEETWWIRLFFPCNSICPMNCTDSLENSF